MAMTDRSEGSEQEMPPTEGSPDFKVAWVHKRRQRIAAEIGRNRRGEYTVPTWVLAMILVAVLAGWALLVILAG